MYSSSDPLRNSVFDRFVTNSSIQDVDTYPLASRTLGTYIDPTWLAILTASSKKLFAEMTAFILFMGSFLTSPLLSTIQFAVYSAQSSSSATVMSFIISGSMESSGLCSDKAQ